MEVTNSKTNITINVVIQIPEDEARALDKFAYFGAYKEVIEFIDKKWANSINKDHLKKFFENVHSAINPHLNKVDKAREILK